MPRSRTNPQFNRETLPDDPGAVQIGYTHVQSSVDYEASSAGRRLCDHLYRERHPKSCGSDRLYIDPCQSRGGIHLYRRRLQSDPHPKTTGASRRLTTTAARQPLCPTSNLDLDSARRRKPDQIATSSLAC